MESLSLVERGDRRVLFNVGGKRFETMKSTLRCHDPNNMLIALLDFSDRSASSKAHDAAAAESTTTTDEKEHFIDRDPELFEHVLQFLRNGELSGNYDVAALLKEADYYHMPSLTRYLLNAPAFSTESVDRLYLEWLHLLSPAWARIKCEEDNTRKPTGDPSVILVDVYDNLAMFIGECMPASTPIILADWRTTPVENELQIARSLQEFKMKFDIITSNVFIDFDWNNCVVAGGAVSLALQPLPADISVNDSKKLHEYYAAVNNDYKERDRGGDIDVFFYGLTEAEATAKLMNIFEKQLTARHGDMEYHDLVVQGANVVTFAFEYPARHIQFILRLYRSVAEVLAGFDVDSCCNAFDGQRVYSTHRGARAWRTKANVVDPSRQSTTYEYRLYKYAKRGFGVVIPGFKRELVHASIYSKTFMNLQGMARLLWFERLVQEAAADGAVVGCTCAFSPASNNPEERERYPRLFSRRHKVHLCPRHPQVRNVCRTVAAAMIDAANAAEQVEHELVTPEITGSDYTSTFLPWGPSWSCNRLLDLLRIRQIYRSEHNFQQAVRVTETDYPPFEQEGAHIVWRTRDPGSQLTGSFHPLYDDWYRMAYTGRVYKAQAIANGVESELQKMFIQSGVPVDAAQEYVSRLMAAFVDSKELLLNAPPVLLTSPPLSIPAGHVLRLFQRFGPLASSKHKP